MERRQLLIVSKDDVFVKKIVERVSISFEIQVESSIHVAYTVSLNMLPDVILFDKTSFYKASDFKNLKSFKSTHFLSRSTLYVYGNKVEFEILKKRYGDIVEEFLPNSLSFDQVAERVQRITSTCKVNYWHECFMGLFNLMAKPVLLLKQNTIIAMNDAFVKTFKVEETEQARLTDFVNIENKAKVKTSLRNFSRGKHLKAVTETVLLVHDEKLRNAKISFSKLSRNINDQFIMIIDFSGEEYTIDRRIGSSSSQVEKCFKENTEMTDFTFTKREKEIISLLCKGYKTREISEALFISPKTIEKHRSNIIKRTNSETILESIIYAINHNLVDY